MKLLVLLATIGVAWVVALLLGLPVSAGTGLVVVMHIATFLVFAALWWLAHDAKKPAALAATCAGEPSAGRSGSGG